ncbi:hypothetical protein [Brevundimonas sp.]|uniref:hypothetical protein n=1 Tax=Brevundimonas sp. TaxID=1871086 RepID=UPI002C009A36|nr:hypothetical protein [Brevundimonas sp.]HWQ86989.1 hypothetical protein [Brevundimonas sp.]
MIAILAAAVLAAQTGPPATGWTWTLYADAAPVVLANEIPDTANLRVTLECDPGSSVARVTLYGPVMTGMARVASGDAVAMAEAEAGRGKSTRLTLRTDHPAFAAFAADGRMNVLVGDHRRPVEVPAPHLAKLRRFSELCSG